jgi:hypothetical protein
MQGLGQSILPVMIADKVGDPEFRDWSAKYLG